jgi:hypothetical protein
MISVVSTAAAVVASDIEDLASTGRIEDCRPLLKGLQVVAADLLDETSRLSIKAMRMRIGAGDDLDQTYGA